ncbi:MAG: tRNA (guanosine(46)-N7)-methyltransferase TrmB [Metamycoplasmataceae bacterium]
MRLKFNKEAKSLVEESNYLIKSFPYKIKGETVIELGMGKGEMLTELAKAEGNKSFIGIEKFDTVTLKALKRFKKENLNNVLVINKDIKNIEEFFEGKVNEIWLTFSDPWPKKRHAKRRLTHKLFLEKYKNILIPNGIIKLKTDNDNFFAYSLESIKEFGKTKILFETNDLHSSIKNENNYYTGYEKKWNEKGKKINYLEFCFV